MGATGGWVSTGRPPTVVEAHLKLNQIESVRHHRGRHLAPELDAIWWKLAVDSGGLGRTGGVECLDHDGKVLPSDHDMGGVEVQKG